MKWDKYKCMYIYNRIEDIQQISRIWILLKFLKTLFSHMHIIINSIHVYVMDIYVSSKRLLQLQFRHCWAVRFTILQNKNSYRRG